MGFEFVSENLEWESLRLAEAFMMREYESTITTQGNNYQIYLKGHLHVEAHLVEMSFSNYIIDELTVSRAKCGWCKLWQDDDFGDWDVNVQSQIMGDLMARGLYCLGFEDEAVSNQLPTLSMHEKLELRLSMPREFWPQKWRDEEGA